MTEQRISLCMIVRNEESFLAGCLMSVRKAVDEVIIVDTGSTDSTLSIASDFDAQVFSFEWDDDFSAARNFSIEKASGDWILVLDADETVASRDAEKIRKLTQGDADAYLFTYRNYSQQSHDIRWVANDGSYDEGIGWDGWIPGRVIRMFKRDDRIRFRGAVHETVDLCMTGAGRRVAETDIIIHHFHERKGPARLREKQLAYLRMSEKNLRQFPNNPKTHFDMGLISRHILNDLPKAILHHRQALDLDPNYEDARMALAFAYHLSGDSKAAARELTILLGGNPRHAPALVLCGIILEKKGRLDRAVESYERAISLNPNIVDAHINLGDVLLRKGDRQGARGAWEHAFRISPNNDRVLLNLGALELSEGNRSRAQKLLERALTQSSQNALLWNNLGVLYAELGRKEDSMKAFEKALELDVSFEHARRNLEATRAGTSA